MAKDTKQKLINTAKDLIGASSYTAVGVAEICKQAGVNKGSFYHFFKSKEELAIEALEDSFKEHESELNEIFAENKTAMQQLDSLTETFYKNQKEEFIKNGKVCGCPAVNLGSEMASQNEHFSESIRQIIQRYEDKSAGLVQKFINEGLIDKNSNPEVLGKIIHTYILGLKFAAKIENNPLTLKSEFKQTVLRILGVKM